KAASKETKAYSFTASVYGGAIFDMDYNEIKAMDSIISEIKGEEMAMGSIPSNLTRGGTFNYLSGTKTEADNINMLLTNNNCIVSLYEGNKFTEGQFKSQSGNNAPQII